MAASETRATESDFVYTQARIRVNEDGAKITYLALVELEESLVQERRDAVMAGHKNDVTRYNADLRAVRRVIEETRSTLQEWGWWKE